MGEDAVMEDERSIMEKALGAGIPASEWGVKIRCGIGAGYRRTAVVDDSSEDGRYVCAVLNSMLGRWFAVKAPQLPPGKASGPEGMPIPQTDSEERRRLSALVEKILATKAKDPAADTSELEESVDWVVFDLYDLTNEETAVVADLFWQGELTEEEEDAAFVRAMEEALEDWGYCDISEAKDILREK